MPHLCRIKIGNMPDKIRFVQLKFNLLKIFILIGLFCFSSLKTEAKERIYIDTSSKKTNEREAILILPGFGSKVHGTKEIANYFFNKQYDVFIPEYLSRNSISNCVENLNDFYIKRNLKGYKKIHVFSYIVGSWALNEWLKKYPEVKIHSIVYDRSPLQERAPYALVQDIPFLIRIISGKIMREFSETPYSPIEKGEINIGILIESEATKLVYKHKKSVFSLGEVYWEVDSLHQNYDDFEFIWINHDEMYQNLNQFADEILFFFANGKFSDKARREKFLEDPFKIFTK